MGRLNVERKKCSKTDEYLEACEHKMAPFPSVRWENASDHQLENPAFGQLRNALRAKQWLSGDTFSALRMLSII